MITHIKVAGSTREVYICCTGLLIGGIIGFRIGKAFNKHNPPVHYMRAIQCTNYSGIEVFNIKMSFLSVKVVVIVSGRNSC